MINADFKTYYSILRQNRKILGVMSLAFAVLFGCYKLYDGLNSTNSSVENIANDYTEQIELYNNKKANIDNYIETIENNISYAYQYIKENPILALDPNNCEYEIITITYDDPNTTRDAFLKNTVAGMNPLTLFGTEGENLDPYKTDVIMIPDADDADSGVATESGKTQIYCFPVGELTAKEIADRFLHTIDPEGTNTIAGATVQSILRTSSKGYCHVLRVRQENLLNYPITLEQEIRRVQEQGRLISKPTSTQATISKQSIMLSSFKYAFLGLLIGLACAIALVLYKVSTSGVILSKNQIDEIIELDCLGSVDTADNSLDNMELITKNIEAVSQELQKVMILDDSHANTMKNLTDTLNKKTGRMISFEFGKNIIDDVNTIDALCDAEGIVLGVDKGVSTITKVQQTIIRANNLNKRLLGYIFVE